MGTDAKVVEVTIELCLMTFASDILVHGSEFEGCLWNKIVHADSRHIQDTVLARSIAIVEVVPQAKLHLTMHEVAYLCITSPVIVTVVNLLALGKADMHIIGLSTDIPAILKHSKLEACTEIIR